MMEANLTFLDCPAYLDRYGARRCGLPAEVEYWYAVESSDGPLESAKIRCPVGHWFNGPVESLVLPGAPDRAVPRPQSGHRPGVGRQPATRAHTGESGRAG